MISDVVDAFVATITRYTTIRCTSDLGSFSPPCVIVPMPESVDLAETFSGARSYVFHLLCITAAKEPRSGRTALEDLVDELVDVLTDHHDLDDEVESVVATAALRWQVQTIQDVECLTCELRVEVLDS